MPLKDDDELIVATINGLHSNTSEDEFRTALNQHSAKSLRKACANLCLGARSRHCAYDNKNGYMKLLWERYKRDGMQGFSGLLQDSDSRLKGRGITTPCRPNPLLSRPDSHEFVPELRLRTTSQSQNNTILEPLLQSLSGTQARKRRRVATDDGAFEFVEHNLEDDVTECKCESEKTQKDKSYDAVVHSSAAVRSAMATLNELKQNHASECLVKAAELVFDRLVLSWTRTMEEASKM
ncbi:hypothetical protein DD238_002987 [Peronospora effusa]|uniref:Uncharacterized protein n=2 Tax=Peronospora effusa TaxID=542832 RepID=A0A3M6VGI3_9STRA|nr:hypothetical protein DD238_002987 [Peronospora effusa]